MSLLSASILLFLVMDPFGNIPFFLAALADVDPKRRPRIVVRELLIALVALVLFLFGGRYLLEVLSLAEPSLTIAGGIILFLIALRMVFPSTDYAEERLAGDPFISAAGHSLRGWPIRAVGHALAVESPTVGVAPLSAEQLALPVAPTHWPIGMLVQHILNDRI